MWQKFKRYLLDVLRPKDYQEVDLKKAFLSRNSTIQLSQIPYTTLSECQFLVTHIHLSFSSNQLIRKNLLKQERQNVYLTDFLYDKIIGVGDYSENFLKFKNDLIELELLLDQVPVADQWTSIVGYNYRTSKLVLQEMYSIVEQIENERGLKHGVTSIEH